MILKLLTKQKRIGVILFLFAFLVFALQLTHAPFGPETPISLGTALLLIGSIFLDNNFFKWVQGGLLLAIGLFYTYFYTDNLFGYWIHFIGLVMLYKYGLIKNRIVLKTAIFIAIYLIVLVLTIVIRQETLNLIVRYFLFSGVSGILVFILFEEDIINLLKIKRKSEKELVELKPIVILGERTSSIVHSFKNLFSQLSSATYYIKENIDHDKGLEILDKVTKELHSRMNALLEISRAGFSPERKLIDVTKVVMNVKYVLLEDTDYKRNAKIELDLVPNVYSEIVELEFIMTLENIFRNAIEAIMETGQYGWIRVTLDHDKLEVVNNGGAIKTCSNCSASCLGCKKFSKIGYTTKERGSGNGIPQVIQFARSSGWDVKISGYDDKTSIKLFHHKGVRNESAN